MYNVCVPEGRFHGQPCQLTTSMFVIYMAKCKMEYPCHIASYSVGANFPKFPKWAHTLGKFILDWLLQPIKLECGLLL